MDRPEDVVPSKSTSVKPGSPKATKPKVKITPKVAVSPNSASESVEDARKSYGQVRKSVLFLVLVSVLYGVYIVFSGLNGAHNLSNHYKGWIAGIIVDKL